MIEYHKSRGDLLNPIVSYSALCALEEHPLKFVKYITGEDSITTPSMTKGDLFHAWLEHRNNFIVSDLDKPAEKLAEFVDTFYKHYLLEEYKLDHMFNEYCKKDYGITMEDLNAYKDIFIALNGKSPNDEETKLIIYSLRYCRDEVEFGGRLGVKSAWKEGTVIEKFKLQVPYLRFLMDSKGKTILTKNEKSILENCKESVARHPFANHLLFELEGQNEVELFWEETINGILIRRKAKVDRIIVDKLNKKLIIVDPKTTAYSVNDFPEGSYKKYKYGGQLNSYADGWFKTNKINPEGWTIELYNIVVQTTDEYPCKVFQTLVYRNSSGELCDYRIDQLKFDLIEHIKTQDWNITIEEKRNGGYVRIN